METRIEAVLSRLPRHVTQKDGVDLPTGSIAERRVLLNNITTYLTKTLENFERISKVWHTNGCYKNKDLVLAEKESGNEVNITSEEFHKMLKFVIGIPRLLSDASSILLRTTRTSHGETSKSGINAPSYYHQEVSIVFAELCELTGHSDQADILNYEVGRVTLAGGRGPLLSSLFTKLYKAALVRDETAAHRAITPLLNLYNSWVEFGRHYYDSGAEFDPDLTFGGYTFTQTQYDSVMKKRANGKNLPKEFDDINKLSFASILASARYTTSEEVDVEEQRNREEEIARFNDLL